MSFPDVVSDIARWISGEGGGARNLRGFSARPF